MRIDWQEDQKRFIAEFNPSQWHADKYAAKTAGFRCTGPDGGWIWYTLDPSVVLSLKGTPGLTISKSTYSLISEAEKQVIACVEASRATDSDVKIPCPKGLAYLPYQRAGIVYASQREGTYLTDQMGLGKSVQAVGVVNNDPLAHRILIICPASLKTNWKREFTKWDVKQLSVTVISEGKRRTKYRVKNGEKFKEIIENVFPETDTIIINYELLEDWREDIRKVEWDLLIVDEAHMMKNPRTGRTQEIIGRKKFGDQEAISPIQARRKLFMTGTPLLNKPVDLWPVLCALDPNGLGHNRREFEIRYCAGQVKEIYPKNTVLIDGVKPNVQPIKKVWDASGASNLEELQKIMRSRFMIRREKKDVLTELPPKRRQVIVVEPGSSQLLKLIAKENQLYDQYAEALKSGKFETPAFSEMSRLRKEIALSKAPFVAEHIIGALDEVKKLCLFAHHSDVVDYFIDTLREFGVVHIDGRTENEARQEAVDRFQTDPNVRIFLGSIQAAGVGLTLTAASLGIFSEIGWTPAEMVQAEDRLHRIGQQESVLIQYIVLEGSLEERQVQLIAQKQDVASRSLDETKA